MLTPRLRTNFITKRLRNQCFSLVHDAAWANQRDLTSRCGFLCDATEENTSRTVTLNLATPSRVTARNVRGSLEVRALPRHKEQLRDKMRWSMSDCCGTNWNKTQWTCRLQDPHTATTLGALLVDARGVFGAVPRSESAGLSTADKHSAVETVSLHEPLTRSRKGLRWLHSDVNVSDGPKKFDHRAVASFPEFLQRRAWEMVFHPTFTSDKKLRGQGRVKKQN